MLQNQQKNQTNIISLVTFSMQTNTVPFRTDPFDQEWIEHKLEIPEDNTRSTIRTYDPPSATTHNEQCPLQFSLGLSRRSDRTKHADQSFAVVKPPVIYPILPAQGPGRQILFNTQYEHLELMTTAKGIDADIKHGLVEHVEFPLLFESSSFLTSPIVSDVNKDGIPDAILADYDGGIYCIGLQNKEGQRWFHRTQVPRIYVRRKWMESFVNETLGIEVNVSEDSKDEEERDPKDRSHRREKPHDPYHSRFEYIYGTPSHHENILRGVPAGVIGQDLDQKNTLEQRRRRIVTHNREGIQPLLSNDINELLPDEISQIDPEDIPDYIPEKVDQEHRRLLEVPQDSHVDGNHRRLQEVNEEAAQEWNPPPAEEAAVAEGENAANNEDTKKDWYGDDQLKYIDDFPADHPDQIPEDDAIAKGDDTYKGDYNFYGDDAPKTGDGDGDDHYGMYDDYYGKYYHSEHDEYYKDEHYVRIPPHILTNPTLMEFPKLYNDQGEHEYKLFVPVSYYMDEDEYEGFFSYKRFAETDTGDETEVERGMYVASAIMVYEFTEYSNRWGRQEHLDMSGDHSAPVNVTLVGSIPLRQENTKMGAFVISSPTVADIDGDSNLEVLMGTSMGIVYCMDGQNLYKKDGWPVQLKHPVESRILVEDVRGDTNLEIFVADIVGNIICLDHKANIVWRRDLAGSLKLGDTAEVIASSEMVMGDVDGDGILDIVVVMRLRTGDTQVANYLFAVSADTGRDIANFPVRVGSTSDEHQKEVREDFVVEKMPAPLLVDLHGDQSFLNDYIRRNGAKWVRPFRGVPSSHLHGGSANGLHIVLPVGKNVVIMEAGSGCSQSVAIGENVLAMVQADDVHGTGSLDLVITTSTGNILTLESKSPFHPLNVWNNGEVRGRHNGVAHGYSASQGIFVHDVSRQYRDVFGVWIPITFEIFDNRPNIMHEPDKRVYKVTFREGIAKTRLQKTYNATGVYTEKMYIPSGPGYYSISVMLTTTHGIIYEDTFHIGYNLSYMDGFGTLLWLPLLISAATILIMGVRTPDWDDDEYKGDVLGSPLPE